MALTPEQIKDEASHHGFIGSTEMLVRFARAIEAEVRKDDEALIEQMQDALEEILDLVDLLSPLECDTTRKVRKAITAGRAWLEGFDDAIRRTRSAP